ncbi:TatD family hydrolase [Methanogenium sp. S4BF]|uniref:TatD family hydrolase n=1 Tax=Methanogenium sp. S4BF TaxID=1789226 RepID=UPI002416F1A6|nr:TatD family hydrolase [Methanogenium sp. S4BF]WFN35294.1 TatD family hydrolase [Methanogenium sp. S4BF]
MTGLGIPVTDDHIHIDRENGRGTEAAKDFFRAGGTHMFLVTKPSWSHAVHPVTGDEFRDVYEITLKTAAAIRETGVVVFPIFGVHPAEIGRLTERMPLAEAEAVMKRGLDIAAEYVEEKKAVALKSGRPHYPVNAEVWEASNRILAHALALAHDTGCALQIHAETGPCADVAEMAAKAGIPVKRVIKHFGTPDTPLMPSLLARSEDIPSCAQSGLTFTMESDYMDDTSRPGAVIGPKSVPRYTRKYLEEGSFTEDDAWKIHAETPAEVYGVEITLS